MSLISLILHSLAGKRTELHKNLEEMRALLYLNCHGVKLVFGAGFSSTGDGWLESARLKPCGLSTPANAKKALTCKEWLSMKESFYCLEGTYKKKLRCITTLKEDQKYNYTMIIFQ
ncbi:hypothetical protein M9H77_09048 [Catharanthus roseus]|uniref:Uncharacterized protein n=1 Tax=Catharanthus roseus TaxID=4058 RepID=A0ACC0BZG5_CATRO|nr:hypothetical protein M9H77_09048 [Catharanthus roseus]